MSDLLDAATQLEVLGAGRYVRAIDEGAFWGMGTPHGGYLMALALHAMQRELDDPARPVRAIVGQFLARVPAGPLEIEVTRERSGRAVTSMSARLRTPTDTALVCTALFTLDRDGPAFVDEAMPEVAPPGEPDRELLGFQTRVHERFDFHRRFGAGGRALPVEDGGWVVARDPGAWDHRLALLVSDVWCPPIIRHPDRMVATPSLHHAVHFGPRVRGDEAEALLVRHRLSSGASGMTDEDIALWAADGRLLVRARQLRMVVDLTSGALSSIG